MLHCARRLVGGYKPGCAPTEVPAAARPESRTERLHAIRRAGQQLERFRDDVFLFDRRNLDPRALARERPKAKEHDTARASHGLPVGEQVGKGDFDFIAGLKPGTR